MWNDLITLETSEEGSIIDMILCTNVEISQYAIMNKEDVLHTHTFIAWCHY